MYTTKQGDTWDKIAYEQYGNELYADKLIMANLKYAGIVMFSAGICLTIPEIEEETEEEIPAWREDDEE